MRLEETFVVSPMKGKLNNLIKRKTQKKSVIIQNIRPIMDFGIPRFSKVSIVPPTNANIHS